MLGAGLVCVSVCVCVCVSPLQEIREKHTLVMARLAETTRCA